MNRLLFSLMLSATVMSATAGNPATNIDAGTSRIGLGQDSAKEPAMLRNLKLDEPLVQKKYLNEPDMLRFLRGTYTEACSRGLLNQAAMTIKLDTTNKFDPAIVDMARTVLTSGRIWRMASFELEAAFGPAYLKTTNYCDCLLKEVADVDLVNPRKGLEVIEKLSPAIQSNCDRIAKEKTERQIKKIKD